MTEAEWLACADLSRLLDHVLSRPGRRKWHLFLAACCRRLDGVSVDPEIEKVLDALERHAEGTISASTLMGWCRWAGRVVDGLPATVEFVSRRLAYAVLSHAAYPMRHPQDWRRAVYTLARGLAGDAGPHTHDAGFWEAHQEASRGLAPLCREICGHPTRTHAITSSRRTAAIQALAQAAYQERLLPSGHLDAARLAVLSDALEEAGCTDADILTHLRSPGPHVRGCWALDLILGRE